MQEKVNFRNLPIIHFPSLYNGLTKKMLCSYNRKKIILYFKQLSNGKMSTLNNIKREKLAISQKVYKEDLFAYCFFSRQNRKRRSYA